jgi:dTDP-4-dehydrorhamnose reductase
MLLTSAAGGSTATGLATGGDSLRHLELWGGIECSVVRIGDEFRNQVLETGHSARLADIDAMAELGIKAVRYPVLWETIAPQAPGELDFSESSESGW